MLFCFHYNMFNYHYKLHDIVQALAVNRVVQVDNTKGIPQAGMTQDLYMDTMIHNMS